MDETITILLGCMTLAVAGLASSVAVYSVFRQLQSGKPRDRFYEDADGCATPETLASFSSQAVKNVILFLSTTGTGVSIATLVLSRTHDVQPSQPGCLLAGNATAWGIILIQSICISVQHSATKSHDLGIGLTASACFLAVSQIPRVLYLTKNNNGHQDTTVVLQSISTGTAAVLAVASILIPRRPDVLFHGNSVDRQWTVSLLSRLTWTWIQPLLRHASVHKDIDVGDVPCPDAKLRSQELKKKWDRLEKNPSLFVCLLTAYKGRLALLWVMTLVRCAMSILPFWFMLLVLNTLEDETTSSSSMELFTLIVCMAASNLLDSWMEGWAYWYSLSDLALPIRSQMSALIFDKALRRKNMRGAGSEDASPQDGKASAHDATALQYHQSIVNLVGIDTERLSYFFQYHFLILNGVVKLIIFSIFLLRLLGWTPFIAGISAWAITLPPNTWVSGKVLAQSQKLMRHRDTKLSKVNEMLLGMRQIKFSALESQWERRILALREAELKTLWRFFLADSGLFACWVVSPILLAVASLVAYVLVNGSLLPSVAFVSVGILNSLETTLGSLPELFTLALDSLVSLRRINVYLNEMERPDIVVDGPSISFERASISWPVDDRATKQDRFVLGELNLSFPKGELSVISGKVGTGKTLLLSAILGEADLLSGTIRVPQSQRPDTATGSDKWLIPGSVAYISQTPWLENASVRNNILFGLPLDKARYSKVVEACALREDLAALPDGDSTELGANGVNLSGGQKLRVTLARAVYSRAEVLLMEDIFSAVDSHVGAWILDRCLAGDLCEGRTRILVTHHLDLVLPQASFVVELSEGGLAYSGPPRKISGKGGQGQSRSDNNAPSPGIRNNKPDTDTTPGVPGDSQPSEPLLRTSRKFIQEETRQKGTVKGSVYLTYVRCSGGLHLWAACVGIYLAYQAGIIGRAWWLRIWTGESEIDASNVSLLGHPTYDSYFATQRLISQTIKQSSTADTDVFFYVKVYVAISLGTALVGILRYISSYFLAVRASRALFQKMLFAVMRAPLRWLDTVPTGRILNRFTADFNIIDERIAMTWSLFLSNLLRMIGICVASCFASVYLVPPALILLGVGVTAGNKYLVVSRPLKRLESNSKSPVFELFNTTLAGLSTIRAFRKTHAYLSQMHSNLDAWAMATFYISLANRWMSFRMALIAALFSVAVGVVIVLNPVIDAALAGLALSFILDFSESLRWMVRCYGDMELEMNSMERAVEYMSLETEPLEGLKPPAAWPTSGSVELKNLEVGYAPDLPPVLRHLSLKIGHGERLGVVGRTGAGKSSLTLALFRLLEARSGSIEIDGLDISKLNLADLRSRISIIPQHPVLFAGTLRSNLDPFDDYTDDQLYETLSRVHLVGPQYSDQSQPSGDNIFFRDLSSPISEAGSNLSHGQQQLVCIAHALLGDSKIIILDEATSAIDVATDTLIQRSIRDWFTDRTLIVVAHRLSTVSDFDKILVLDNGRMVEFGTPRDLWQKNGTFRGMCDSTGERETLRRSILELRG